MKLKMIMTIPAVICMAVFGSSLLVPTASAAGIGVSAPVQPSQLPAAKGADCTKGCVIYTCRNGSCSVWYCSGKIGCKQVGQFNRPVAKSVTAGPQGGSARPDPIQPPEHSFRNQIAYAKVCPSGDTCNLYALDGSRSTVIGSFPNSDALIKSTIKSYEAQQAPNGFATPQVR